LLDDLNEEHVDEGADVGAQVVEDSTGLAGAGDGDADAELHGGGFLHGHKSASIVAYLSRWSKCRVSVLE